ncbi:MAG: hypothetical protein HC809_15330 [Gammaproteobacteria bacterium]|nr:hypothetical protein [Gammaproteobacteria bacterium]
MVAAFEVGTRVNVGGRADGIGDARKGCIFEMKFAVAISKFRTHGANDDSIDTTVAGSGKVSGPF